MTEKKRVAVFISGRGSNMEALIAATRESDFPAEIVGVIANKADAAGLETASAQGIETAVFSLKQYADKAASDAAIDAQLRAWNIDIVCLAGFMRLLSPEFCAQWEGKMINIHPSLLPAYKGLNTHQRALDDDAENHGCTVHFVTAGMDEGPIIGQVVVPVLFGDTESMLAARVLQAEHKLYPWALEQLALGAVSFK